MNQFVKDNYPFIVFFFLILMLHLVMGFNGDDVKFAKMLSNYSLFDYLNFRYHSWSSRLIIESVLVFLTRQNMLVWKILDCVLSVVGVYYVIKLINRTDNKHIAFLGVLLFLMYPFHEMASAGWISTTLNYLWCFSLGVVAFVPVINRLCGENTHKLTYIVSFIALLFAVNQEQSCALVFAFNGLYLLKMRDFNWYSMSVFLVSGLSLIFILTCPGNSIRFATEIGAWYPEFARLGILEKIYLGIVPTFGLLLEEKIIFPLFYVMLSLVFKSKNRYFACFNIALILVLVMVQTFSDVSSIIGLADTMSLNFKGDSFNLFYLLISLYLLLSSCWMLFKSFDRNSTPLLVFVFGFLSKFMMGFSPVVFVSGPRTMMFFYFALISLILMIVLKIYGEGRINEKWGRIMTYCFILLAGLNYLAVSGIVLLKYSII